MTVPARPAPSRATWVSLVVVLGLLVAAVVVVVRRSGDDGTKPVAASATTSTSATTTTVAPTTSTNASTTTTVLDATQAKLFDEVKAQVADVRGLKWVAPLDIRVVSRADLAAKVQELNVRDRKPDRIAGDGEALHLLKLLPRTSDYAKAIDDLYSGAVIGFYDPKTKQLFVGANPGGITPGLRLTIAHEMLHAITDQNFGFGARTQALDDADKQEELSGFVGLLEGDAKLLESLWSRKYLTAGERRSIGLLGDASAYNRAPRYLKDSLLFPYSDGLDFVVKQYSKGGYAAVDAAYRNPPTSTEQVLHPETYRAGQGWTPPPVPALASATRCAPVRDGTLGEFEMREILEESLSTTDSEAAAAGWNGDRFSVVRCGSALGMLARWQADSDAAASRLFGALVRWARTWSGSTVAPDGRFAGPSGFGRLTRNGSRIDIVLADDGPTSDKVAAAAGS